jgi:hypothetical protein
MAKRLLAHGEEISLVTKLGTLNINCLGNIREVIKGMETFKGECDNMDGKGNLCDGVWFKLSIFP